MAIKLILPSGKQQKKCPHNKGWGIVIGTGELICELCYKILTKKDIKAILKREGKNE